MEGFRSRSHGDVRMEMEVYGSTKAPPSFHGMQDPRSYNTSYASSQHANPAYNYIYKEMELKKEGSSSKGFWCLSDPELQRKKRVTRYKAYTVEGKMKGTLRRSFRWIKDRYTQMVNG